MSKKIRLLYEPSTSTSRCPYRLLDCTDREIQWACQFLDAQHLRGFSLASLRAYGYDLLNFSKWLHKTRSSLSRLNQARLLSYVRYQLNCQPKPTPQTINHRLVALHCLYRFHYGCDIPQGQVTIQSSYKTRNPLGYGKPRRRLARLRLKQPRRVVIPLTADEVARFWSSFRSFRDLSLVALMLFNGLRSRETIQIQLEDLHISQAQLLIRGKGKRERIVPLADETIQILQRYLGVERPLGNSPYLFLSLKGPHRGQPMTSAGLRSLFRHHRRCSDAPQANAHRFRHTFGSDMVRAGLSLPALMRLMGHSNIHTTMLYVELSREDVWREYQLALQRRASLPPPEVP
ncbi:MAG TPA: tyrosine-type recombinase/integrase [Candidatus Binatia bacterium]|nr:tyrosine-type recombinase/integrase [Candidatus Binatia bacterium]